MPRNPNHKRIELLLSPAQYEALLREMQAQNVSDAAQFVRQTLVKAYPSIPDDLLPRGKYRRNEDDAE